MPEPRPYRKKGGGTFTHKNPDCACLPCTARRRKAEALSLAARGGDEPTQDNGEVLEVFKTEKRHSARTRIAQWLEYRASDPNLTDKAIAEKMGIHPKHLTAVIGQAKREGWLQFTDPLDKLEYEIFPKVVENLGHFLDIRDQKVTIEAAKGLVFPKYKETQGIHEAPKTILAIKIETSAPQVNAIVASGQILGKPRAFIDAEEVKQVEDSNAD